MTLSKRQLRAINAKAPTVRQEFGRVRGWNGALSPVSHGATARGLLRQRFPAWTRQEHDRSARGFEQAALRLDAAWSRTWANAFQRVHGRKPTVLDYRVSGIGSVTLHENDKKLLRGLTDASNRAGKLASAHRAAGRHLRRLKA